MDRAVTDTKIDAQAWENSLTQLKAKHGEKTYEAWLSFMEPKHLTGQTLEIALPNALHINYIRANLLPSIRRCVISNITGVHDVRLVLRSQSSPKRPIARETFPPPRDQISSPLDPRYVFDNFMVGRPNQFCHAAAKRVSESFPTEFNPLFIHGGVGLGKTHLMQAIAWDVRQNRPDARVVYLSAERFVHAFVTSIQSGKIADFKKTLRSADLLMIDDIQFIAGKDSSQEEFFHTFNYLIDEGRQMVFSGDRPPGDIDLEERIRSRLSCGLVVDVHPMDYELRLSILLAKAKQYPKLDASEEVLAYLARNLTTSVRELEGALLKINAHVDISHQDVTIDLVRDLLQDMLRGASRRTTMREIQTVTADHYGLKRTDLLSRRRTQKIVRPRQVAMYLCKQVTTKSLPEIARAFDGRDHTTVMYAIRKIDSMRKEDAELDADIGLLLRRIQG
ncbi:MAG: chromosomal replication initiator protein DnaA [Pseudomonadota bacterium]